MKIVLISTLIPNQGLATLSSILKNAGYDVTMVFMMIVKREKRTYYKKELKQLELICKNCDLVGVSSFSSTALNAIQIIDSLKGKVPNIVWGGVHATLYPEHCITHCDIVCVGEGEGAILDLANAIKNNKPIDNIKNLWIKKDNNIIKNPIRNLIDKLDEIPFPDFDIENHFILKKGHIIKFKEEDFESEIRFMTQRGCPNGCDFCSNNAFNKLYEGKRKCILRWNSIDYIINGLAPIIKKFPSIESWYIGDDLFFSRSLEQIKEFSEKYKKKIGINFLCLADPRSITEEKMGLLAGTGCNRIQIGIQSTERVNREVYHRYTTNEQILMCSKILKKFSKEILTNYDVINCNPYEKPEDIVNLINLLRKIPKPYRLTVSSLVYYPGTNIANRALKDRLITKKDLLEEDYYYKLRILLKRSKNLYLDVITNLMEGNTTKNKIGLIHDSWFNYLLNEKRIKKNLKNPFLVVLFVRLFWIHDWLKYKIFPKFPILIKMRQRLMKL